MKKILIAICILTLVTFSSASSANSGYGSSIGKGYDGSIGKGYGSSIGKGYGKDNDNGQSYNNSKNNSNKTTSINYQSNNWKEEYTKLLIMHNYIRQASIDEISKWSQIAQANGQPTKNMMTPGFTYVVQKSFNIPNDFCYGHYINFIIPKGVSEPSNIQNCGFYFLQDGSRKDKCLEN